MIFSAVLALLDDFKVGCHSDDEWEEVEGGEENDERDGSEEEEKMRRQRGRGGRWRLKEMETSSPAG